MNETLEALKGKLKNELHEAQNEKHQESGTLSITTRSSASLSVDEDSAALEEAARSMGAVLGKLRKQGAASASAAFDFFKPSKNKTVEASHMLEEIQRLQALPEDKASRLVEYLDPSHNGQIPYKRFRTVVYRFLTTSHNFHSCLSDEVFNVIMNRIQAHLQGQNLSITQGFQQCDTDGTGKVDGNKFMAALRSLHLGLSEKEVVQLFVTLQSTEAPPSAGQAGGRQVVQNGKVVLSAFEAVVAHASRNHQRQKCPENVGPIVDPR